MLTKKQRYLKRTFDVVISLCGILATFWLMAIAWVVATLETRSNGLFMQKRIGEGGKPFWVYKIKTMRPNSEKEGSVTTSSDRRITKSGAFLRRWKIDELPQLFNVLFGTMSLVGPRPDVEGFADRLTGEDRVILSTPPGITGPASLKYHNEEYLLAQQSDPYEYNQKVIWPDKVRINKAYLLEWSLKKDIGYILATLKGA